MRDVCLSVHPSVRPPVAHLTVPLHECRHIKSLGSSSADKHLVFGNISIRLNSLRRP